MAPKPYVRAARRSFCLLGGLLGAKGYSKGWLSGVLDGDCSVWQVGSARDSPVCCAEHKRTEASCQWEALCLRELLSCLVTHPCAVLSDMPLLISWYTVRCSPCVWSMGP